MKLAPEELLVIIDPQKDFTDIGGDYAKRHPISHIQRVQSQLNDLIKRLDKNKFVIIFSNYQKDQFGTGTSMCIEETKGHEIDLDYDESSILIPKTEHSSFSSQEFKDFLKENQIRRLILCGFLAEYCIKQTALDALKASYEIVLLKELIQTGDDVQYRIEEVLVNLESQGAVVKGNLDFE
ncbi:isochorismatase family cysteine hydrolase [Flavobacterium sp. CFBP9031]|jgi:nicotinamidase/pyrazinamidase|uniref:cysteine hydrolase family protein n=1 Tax=Flavobacterium sp. CFBP9031 TaxID=3096538 RepID=UPI002A6B112B|nr:isochorismatase family cysteine hydrolase [Flavobacterium sp. CFBP9031]MDY0989270.1 isochorismatase family cysteine hydrolase [Flavobacterium sp. CFBP9031]